MTIIEGISYEEDFPRQCRIKAIISGPTLAMLLAKPKSADNDHFSGKTETKMGNSIQMPFKFNHVPMPNNLCVFKSNQKKDIGQFEIIKIHRKIFSQEKGIIKPRVGFFISRFR